MKRFLIAFFIFIFTTIVVTAQTTTGRLVGTVAEANGAVIPGATVVVIDSQTGKERTTTSNAEGGFTVPLLDVGTYTVKVTSKGFKSTTTSITIQIGQEYSLGVQLTVGDVSENVTVTAGTDIMNTTNGELSSTLTNRQITELPLATRNPLALILTQAGSASNPNQGTSIDGGRTSSTNITRDGVNIQDNFIRSNATDFSPGRPSVDNVEEFTLSAQSSVDTGFGSAQVNFVTPRGGNQFHGAGWEYNRNSAVGANGWFANAGGNHLATDSAVINGFRKAGEEKNPRPFRNRNQYGVKVSGPIIKDKLFFFAFGEKLNDIVTASRVILTLSPEAKAGIFRYADNAGVIHSANIFTPGVFTTNTTLTGSGVAAPTTINSAVAAKYLANMPDVNSFEVGDLLNSLGHRFFQNANQTRDSLTGRLDYDLNSKNNINAVIDYNFEHNLRNDIDQFNPIPNVNQPARNVLYSGGWRYSPTANISNEFRIGRIYSKPDFFRTDAAATEFFQPPTTLIASPEPQNNGVFRNQGRAVKTVNAQDTVSWLFGNHTLRFGAQFQRVEISAYNDAGIDPVYNFGISSSGPVFNAGALVAAAGGGPALTSAQQTTARNLYALLGGVISSGSQTFNATSQTSGFVNEATNLRQFHFYMLAPYVLDSWKLRPELTINAGLRYDYQAPLVSTNGLYFEATIADGRAPKDAVLDPAGTLQFIGGNSGKKNTFYKADNNNWAPSVSVAWAPKSVPTKFLKWITGRDFVVRGGYRLSYVNDELVRAPDNALSNHPGFSSGLSALATLNNLSSSTAIDDRFGSPHTSGLSVPTFISTRSYTTNNTASFLNTGTVFAIDPNLKTPTQNDYSVGISRQFGNWVAELRYVGGFSNNMLRTIDYNQIMIPDAYRADFNIVRTNLLNNCGQPVGTNPTAGQCATGTTLISTMVGAGNITPTNANGILVNQGQIAELAWQQLINGNIPNPNTVPYPTGTLRAQFLPNPNTGVANVLENGGSYNYNAGQFELRRRFEHGLSFQANYTFSKELTDAIGTAQTRVEPFLDNNDRSLDYTRADYDQTHVINLNGSYELPFGKGRQFLNSNKWLDYAIGGWQFNMIWRLSSGSPITFTDNRGTLNRSGRSARQTALTNLTAKQLKDLVGVFKTPCGVYFINPGVININQSNLAAGNCGTALNVGVSGNGGVASNGFGSAPFTGQVFFSNGPGQTSGLRRAVVNGPWASSADISLLKNFRIAETVSFQVRGEAFNFLNAPYFAPGQTIDINSTSFGRITSVAVGARVVQFAGRLTF